MWRQRLPRTIVEEAIPTPRCSRDQYDAWISRDAPCWFPSYCNVWPLPEAAPWGWVPSCPPYFTDQTPAGRFFFFLLKTIFQGSVLSYRTSILLKFDIFCSVAFKGSKAQVKSTCCTGRLKHHNWAQELVLLAVLWPCLLFSLLCSALWGAGWQSWRHVFGLVSRSAMPHWRFWACWPCVYSSSSSGTWKFVNLFHFFFSISA